MLEALSLSKVCKECQEELPLDAFSPQQGGKLGRNCRCKKCRALIARRNWDPTEEQREEARQRTRAWGRANLGRKRRASLDWARNNPEKHRIIVQRWRKKNTEKVRAYYRKWWESHKDEARTASKRWQQENHEAYCAAQKRWRLENATYNKELQKRWRLEHPEYGRNRANAVALGDLTWDQWVETLAYFNHACAYCLRSDVDLSVDHLIPVSRGGHHTRDNVVPACKPCNSKKGARPIFLMPRKQTQTHTEMREAKHG